MTGREAFTSSESSEAYSPSPIIELARKVMGGIDLDPSSCEEANKVVKAERFYTMADDGLYQPWAGRTWLNCPGGRGGVPGRWYNKLALELVRGEVPQVTILIFRWDHSSDWWRKLMMFKPSWCLLRDRQCFWGPGGGDSPVHCNGVIYIGDRHANFATEFSLVGDVAGSSGIIACRAR